MNGRYVVSSSSDETVRVWDVSLDYGKEMVKMDEHDNQVNDAKFSNNV